MAPPDYGDYQEVDCKLLDGTIIRGWFYAADGGPAPTIIMTPGMNCVKRILLPQVAKSFQSMGFNAYVYDPRSIGESDGMPRNQIDPLRYAEDLSDIVTHMGTLPSVDSNSIILWGMSFGGTVSGCAAVVDVRVKAVIMVCPILDFFKPEKKASAFTRVIADRESQLLKGTEPGMIHTFTSKGDNIIGMAGAGGPGGLEAFWFMNLIVERGGPTARDHVTLESWHKMAFFRPKEILQMLDTPVMMLIPELDVISSPELQQSVFDSLTPIKKKALVVKGKGHLNALSGKGSDIVIKAQADFLRATLKMDEISSKL